MIVAASADDYAILQSMIHWRLKKSHPAAVLPAKKNPSDGGWDMVTTETYTLQPGERHTFGTGLAAELTTGYVAVIKDRSSLGSQGIHVLAGVIDAAYRGEWKIVLLNAGQAPYTVTAGDLIAQYLLLPVPDVTVTEVTEVTETTRGAGGFGSTGK